MASFVLPECQEIRQIVPLKGALRMGAHRLQAMRACAPR